MAGSWLQQLKDRTRTLRREVYALYLAIQHAQTPWYAKFLAACVIAYALSPIDLIPDPVPVLGYLDDIVIVPLGILLVRRLIPAPVLAECRDRATAGVAVRPIWKWTGLIIIGLIWLAVLVLSGLWVWHWWATS